MTINDPTKELKKLESNMNKHLYLISGVLTVITMVMILMEFISRGDFPSTKISMLYLGILLIYSLHKELVRWLGERKVDRQGEIFVFSWIALAVVLHLVNFLAKDYFYYSVNGELLPTLKTVSIITLEVLIIYVATRASKTIKCVLRKEKKL